MSDKEKLAARKQQVHLLMDLLVRIAHDYPASKGNRLGSACLGVLKQVQEIEVSLNKEEG